MKKWVVCTGLMLLAEGAYAQVPDPATELDALRKVVKQQQEVIEALMKRVEALEAKAGRPRQAGDAAATTEAPSPSQRTLWTDRVDVTGELRYRFQHVDEDIKGVRDRHRIRARVGLEFQATDTFDMGFRLATGGNDPTTANQTLTGGGSKKDVALDLAYFDWHPAQIEGLHVSGGKLRNPFYRPGKSQLVWDSDLTPEGLVLTYAGPLGVVDLFGALGLFQIEERAESLDTRLWGAQAGFELDLFDDKAQLTGGVSVYNYHDIKGRFPPFDPTASFGNSSDRFGLLRVDFNELELFAQLDLALRGIPVTVFGDYVVNTAADTDNTGWLAGFIVGNDKERGDWRFRYIYRDLERDAVVGLFTDSDFGGGGTNVRGHKMKLSYQIAKPVRADLTYFLNERIRDYYGALDYERLTVDLNIKF